MRLLVELVLRKRQRGGSAPAYGCLARGPHSCRKKKTARQQIKPQSVRTTAHLREIEKLFEALYHGFSSNHDFCTLQPLHSPPTRINHRYNVQPQIPPRNRTYPTSHSQSSSSSPSPPFATQRCDPQSNPVQRPSPDINIATDILLRGYSPKLGSNNRKPTAFLRLH